MLNLFKGQDLVGDLQKMIVKVKLKIFVVVVKRNICEVHVMCDVMGLFCFFFSMDPGNIVRIHGIT